MTIGLEGGAARTRLRLARVGLALSAALAGIVTTWLAPTVSARAVAPASPDFYGVASATALDEADFARLSRANIGTVRIQMFWPEIEKQNGEFDWMNFDGSVIKAAEAGITLMPTLIGVPKRISENPFRPPVGSGSERGEWQGFVRAAVERYGPGGEFWDFARRCPPLPGYCRPDLPYRPLTVWQAWNEPNLRPFWRPRPSPDQYAELLRLTSDAVHDVDPRAEVITGGIVAGRPGSKSSIPQNDFIAALYQRGLKDSAQGIGLHPFRRKPRQVRRRVRDARAVANVFGDPGMTLWITEVGWSTKGPKKSRQVTSRKGQAKRLSRTMRMLTRLREKVGLRLASWFTYEDPGYLLCEWCWGAGLFNRKDKPKPAWKRYVRVTGGRR